VPAARIVTDRMRRLTAPPRLQLGDDAHFRLSAVYLAYCEVRRLPPTTSGTATACQFPDTHVT
jgi:hypothetical protein